jgi:RimJ/RimL family protein N-acetyltransferase
MTAVARDWRGRGVAGALKRATIRWAIEHGLEALDTGNDPDNAAMRAVNARLGFRPMPDFMTMRGPLFGGMMDR